MKVTIENLRRQISKQPSWLFVNNVKRRLLEETTVKELYLLHLYLGEAYLTQQKSNYAHHYLDLALEHEETAEAFFLKGNAFYYQGADEDAIACYLKTIERAPPHNEAHYSIGNIHHLKNKNEEAKTWFEKTIAINADHYEASLNLGNVYVKLGQANEGAKLKFRYDSQDIEELLTVAKACWKKGDPGGCFRALTTGLSLATTPQKEAQLLKELGMKTFLRRYGSDPKKATSYLEKALKQDPSDAQTYGALGLISFRQNDLVGAKKNFEKSLKIDPTHARRLYYYSCVLSKENEHEAALEVLEKSYEINPYDKDVCFELGSTRAQNSDDESAERLLLFAERLGHPSAQNRRLESYSKIAHDFMKEGNSQFQKRKYKAAIKSFTKAIGLFESEVEFNGDNTYSNITSCLNNIGYAMAIQKDPEGESYLNRAIDRDPLYLDAVNNLGNLHLKLCRPERALEQFNKVKRLDKHFASAYYNSGKIYLEQLQEYDKAIEELDVAIRIYGATRQDKLGNDASYLRGKCNEALENYVDAKEDYYQAHADNDVHRIEAILNPT